jgi:plasmid stabilization system protein ParE
VRKRIRVEDAARDELRAAVAWYEEKRPGLGAEFLAEVQGTLELIERHPGLGGHVPQVASERGARRLPLRRFPYAIVYRQREAEIQVVAFAHHSRKPGYWRSR